MAKQNFSHYTKRDQPRKRPGKHSKKPDEFRDLITELIGSLPRIELFARQKTSGWDVWGDDVPK